jgi:hypothetical protein
MFGDMSAQGEKIVNGFRRPVERHTPRGDRRSFGVSQEETHSLTRACAMPLPRSSEASARAMPEICHSLVSRYAEIASDARNERERPVFLASFSRRLLVERPTRTENVVVFICIQYSREPWLPQVARKAACTRAATMKFTSRILVGLTALRGLVEPREGIGCWVVGCAGSPNFSPEGAERKPAGSRQIGLRGG